MHPKSIYADSDRLDFRRLAAVVPAFQPFVNETSSGKPFIDFDDAEAVRQLTYALLKRDFGITLELPEDRLCPGVPGRLDYVLYMLDVAEIGAGEAAIAKGLDIGTGASAIYPLLATHQRPGLVMYGTECDQHSLGYAAGNVSRNDLKGRIRIVSVDSHAPYLAATALAKETTFDFSLCNPPFYSSSNEMQDLTGFKTGPALAACTGAPSEMIVDGGEVAFVKRMMAERIHDRIRWVSSLCGKFSSVIELVAELKRLELDNFALAELQQGQTRRWVIAWSCRPDRLPDALARSSSPALQKLLPLPNSSTILVTGDSNDLAARLETCLHLMGVSFTHEHGETPTAQSEVLIRCSIVIDEAALRVDWLYGRQRTVLESFVAHLRSQLAKG